MDDKFKLYSVFNDESNKILQINEIEKDLKCKEFLLAQDPRTSFLGFRLIVNNETIGKKNTNLIFFIIFWSFSFEETFFKDMLKKSFFMKLNNNMCCES